jgi:N-methylhydantoinase A
MSSKIMLPGSTPISNLRSSIAHLLERAHCEIQSEGFEEDDIRIESFLDMRYRGQSYELTIPFTNNFVADFHEGHCQAYGYARPEASLEIVNLRIRATGVVTPPVIPSQPPGDSDPSQAQFDTRQVVLPSGEREIPLYRGESLHPGNILTGPAIVVRDDTTILIGENDTGEVDPYLNLILEIGS